MTSKENKRVKEIEDNLSMTNSALIRVQEIVEGLRVAVTNDLAWLEELKTKYKVGR